jgi:hypothetical protein
MRSLDEARDVCERYHPGLCAAFADISLVEREAPGGPVLDILLTVGGPGLMVPTVPRRVVTAATGARGRWRRGVNHHRVPP